MCPKCIGHTRSYHFVHRLVFSHKLLHDSQTNAHTHTLSLSHTHAHTHTHTQRYLREGLQKQDEADAIDLLHIRSLIQTFYALSRSPQPQHDLVSSVQDADQGGGRGSQTVQASRSEEASWLQDARRGIMASRSEEASSASRSEEASWLQDAWQTCAQVIGAHSFPLSCFQLLTPFCGAPHCSFRLTSGVYVSIVWDVCIYRLAVSLPLALACPLTLLHALSRSCMPSHASFSCMPSHAR